MSTCKCSRTPFDDRPEQLDINPNFKKQNQVAHYWLNFSMKIWFLHFAAYFSIYYVQNFNFSEFSSKLHIILSLHLQYYSKFSTKSFNFFKILENCQTNSNKNSFLHFFGISLVYNKAQRWFFFLFFVTFFLLFFFGCFWYIIVKQVQCSNGPPNIKINESNKSKVKNPAKWLTKSILGSYPKEAYFL